MRRVLALGVFLSFLGLSGAKVIREKAFFSIKDSKCQGLSFVSSPDLLHVACFVKKNKALFLQLDEKSIGPFPGFSSVSPKISKDGKHYAFVTAEKKGGKVIKYVVHDGKRYGPYRAVRNLTLSADGNHVLYFYLPMEKKLWAVARDGELIKNTGSFFSPLKAVSPSNLSYAFACRMEGKGEREFVFLNGKEIGAYDDVVPPLRLSPDGTKLLYTARIKGEVYLFLNGKKLTSVHRVKKCTFSRDSSNFACLVKKGASHFVITSSKTYGPYKDVYFPSLRFSEDGKHVLYLVKEGGKQFVYLDGRKVDGGYSRIRTTQISLSKDGKHILFVGSESQGGRKVYYLIKDGKVILKSERKISSPLMSPDGNSYAYAVYTGGPRIALYKNGKKLGEFSGVMNMVFSPGGRLGYMSLELGKAGFIIRPHIDSRAGASMEKGVSFLFGKGALIFLSENRIRYLGVRGGKICMVEEEL